ncbi:hypothetical protein [Chelativorans sp.]|uniref:hypothetical protein n=1 Tax=Chelativorans sp. TaxID=2203393 RepID=UPI002811CD52|nr:hypothetical protein [Chelativorans sp.]
MKSNRHIVDQLADVRAQKKALEAKEEELKVLISKAMGSADSLGGDQFIAFQKVSTRKGIYDMKKIEATFGDMSLFRKPDVTVYQIVVEPRIMEAAE